MTESKIDLAELRRNNESVRDPLWGAFATAGHVLALIDVVEAAKRIHELGEDAMPDDWIRLADALAPFTDSAEGRSDA